MRYEEGFWLTGPEKVQVQEAEKLKFRVLLFVASMGLIMGWACNR
jgi:hypothetical protein